MSMVEERSKAPEVQANGALVDRDRPVTSGPRRQLSLKGLFFCMTYFGISSALAVRFGLGIFVTMNGVFLTWLSYRGYLWWMQTNKARPKLFGLAWLAFGTSMFLPVIIVGCQPPNAPPQPEYGWEIAIGSATMFQECAKDTGELLTARVNSTDKSWPQVLLQWIWAVIANLPNALLILSPWALYRMQRDKGNLFATVFGCAAVSSWMWSVSDDGDLLVGYYVWSTAVSLPFFARPARVLALLAMGSLAAFILAIQWWAM